MGLLCTDFGEKICKDMRLTFRLLPVADTAAVKTSALVAEKDPMGKRGHLSFVFAGAAAFLQRN